MRLLLPVLIVLLAAIACATGLQSKSYPPLLIKNQSWQQVAVYNMFNSRRLGTCESLRSCNFRIRASDVVAGRLQVGYRELTWNRDDLVVMPEVTADLGPWLLTVHNHRGLSTIFPAPRTK